VGETAQEEAHPLDNAVWWSLDTRHRDLSRARGRARAYRSDTSVFSAVEAFEEAAWTDLSELLGPSRDSVLFCADTPSDLPDVGSPVSRWWSRATR
jgi:hypothetical protein